MKLVQVSDLHMMPDGENLHGLNPAARLRECVADINRRAGDAQLCMVTGDLADKGESGAYEAVRVCLDELTMPSSRAIPASVLRGTYGCTRFRAVQQGSG